MAPMDWIFIRGLVREAAHWGEFGRDFEAAFAGARVHYLDIPGNGELHLERTPVSVPGMSERLRAEARARGIERPHLLALSLGGMVACDWAHRHPQELAGIVLVNTSFGGFSAPLERLRVAALRTLMRAQREADLYHRELQLLRITSNRSELHQATAARWAGIARARPVSRANAARQMLAGARFRPPRTRPSVPHLLLVGGGDQLCAPDCSRAIADSWGGPIEIHPTAGHDLSLDAGPWMIEKISAWLEARVDA
jgi:pimeloyl-ACP methyl ester carboxylesterase